MARLRPLDRVLVALLVPVWLLCFGLSIETALRPHGLSPVLVARGEGADAPPTVIGFQRSQPGGGGGLAIGDRLLRVGDADLRGAGPVEVFLRFPEQSGASRRVRVLYERDGAQAELTLSLSSSALTWPLLPAALVYLIVALVLLLRAEPSPLSSAFFRAFLCTAFFLAGTFLGDRAQSVLSLAVHAATMTLIGPLNLRAFLMFPSGRAPAGALARYGPWLLAPLGPLHMSRFGFPPPPALAIPLVAGGVALMLVAILAIATRSYRRADPIGRRQLRWFLLGVYLAILPPAFGAALGAVDERFTPVYIASLSTLLFVPLALLVSIARYNLFDVDRLISATASINLLLAALLGGGIVGAPRIARAASSVLGVDPVFAEVALALVAAPLALLAQQRLRRRIEQALFPERFAVDEGIEALLREVSRCPDATALTKLVGESLCALFRPESCVLYGQDPQGYTPLFAAGRVALPALDQAGPLVATFRGHAGPVTAGEPGRSRAPGALAPFDRAALETLDAAVVVPIWRGEVLAALACLGPKRSRDVYTPTDVALLARLGERISAQLLRFDQAELIRAAEEMQQTLRRYVPAAIAERLASGAEIEPGEREVAVLFVDIRGYTAYCQSLRPDQIFSAVSRYAETTSEIARDHGGHVVEFHGDGLMAVFGAPEPLPAKERRAVEAASAIAAAVARLELPRGGPGGEPLQVGVGVATGPAFVGSIRSADQLVWSVLGHTTNLAARLQALSRELGAAIVLDARTWSAAGPAAAGFERHTEVRLRGLPEPLEVYARAHPPGVAELAPA